MMRVSELIDERNRLKQSRVAVNNDNNVNSDIEKDINNDINDNGDRRSGKYELDRKNFTPRTESTKLAEEIASKMGDLKNYACYLSIVKKVGVDKAKQLMVTTLRDVADKAMTKTPVRKKGAYLVWKYRTGRY